MIQLTTEGRHWMNRALRNTSVIVPKIMAPQNTIHICPVTFMPRSLKYATCNADAAISAIVA